MTDILTVTIERTGRRTVVHVSGEVDMSTQAILADGLNRALAEDTPDTLIVDLTSTTFLASAGLAALAAAHSRAEAADASMAVVVTSGSAAERAITITGLDLVFPLVDNLGHTAAERRAS